MPWGVTEVSRSYGGRSVSLPPSVFRQLIPPLAWAQTPTCFRLNCGPVGWNVWQQEIPRFGTVGFDGNPSLNGGALRICLRVYDQFLQCQFRWWASANVHCVTLGAGYCVDYTGRSAAMAYFVDPLRYTTPFAWVMLAVLAPVNSPVRHLGRWQGNFPTCSWSGCEEKVLATLTLMKEYLSPKRLTVFFMQFLAL